MTGQRGPEKPRKHSGREHRVIVYFFLLLFLGMTVNFLAYVAFSAPQTINNSYNMRQKDMARQVIRGEILAADGTVLARQALDQEDREVRNYPYGRLFAHVVGFADNGAQGIEYASNVRLLTSNAPMDEKLSKEMSGLRNYGDTAVTSLDIGLQKAAFEALGNYRGAVVAMEPKTGRVLAMVSKPDFDPNFIVENWDEISSDEENSPLVNRAAQGLYPPGSTFKIATLLEYLREHPGDYGDYRYTCSGRIREGENTIECYHGSVHGSIDLTQAFAKSCNCSFASMGLALSVPDFEDTAAELLFDRKLPIDLSYSRSRFSLNSQSESFERMQTAMGQGKTLVTPMHMALITSAIANGGVMMKATEIDRIQSYKGTVVKEYPPEEYRRIMSQEEAIELTAFMEEVVNTGTGRKLKGLPYTVAGKTGSAEFGTEKGKSHAWFTGFSNVEDPELTVTVLIEGAGSGSDYAVPVAKRVFDAYYS